MSRLRLSVALSVEAARCWSTQRVALLEARGMQAEATALAAEFRGLGQSDQLLLVPVLQA